MTNRMDHTLCTHSRDMAGRTACRKGNVILIGSTDGDMVEVTGRGWFCAVKIRKDWDIASNVRLNTGEWVEAWMVTGSESRPA